MPRWLIIISWVSIAGSFICSLAVLYDIIRGNRQKMWIMNVVWPITTLYSGPLGLWAYFQLAGCPAQNRKGKTVKKENSGDSDDSKPFWQSVALGATHCGGGCTLGDLIAEWFLYFFPLTVFGYHLFAGWLIDFLLAYVLGIAFQYFAIQPMRHLSVGRGLIAAVKADTLSLTSWQVGMYGWMAIATFIMFGTDLPKTSPVFWFMMQIAMVAGFMTAYPVNWWLIRRGIKERM